VDTIVDLDGVSPGAIARGHEHDLSITRQAKFNAAATG
jgi:hypothetical protein